MNAPEPSPRSSDSASAIRSLTLAVWVLAALLAIHIGVSVLSMLPSRPATINSKSQGATLLSSGSQRTDALPEALAAEFRVEEGLNGFSDWPLEKQIDKASVIAIAKYQKEGNRYKAIISEVLKKAPNTKFYYNVGDEYTHGGHYDKAGTSYGDGQIIFFVGSPASMRYSCSFHGERIAAFGDMPFDELRKAITKE